MEFTFLVVSSGNKIDVWLLKNFPHHFTMQNLSSNLNTVFKIRNQIFRDSKDGLYYVVELLDSLPIFSQEKIVFLLAKVSFDVVIFLTLNLGYTLLI